MNILLVWESAFEEVFTAQGGRIVGKESHSASTPDFSAF